MISLQYIYASEINNRFISSWGWTPSEFCRVRRFRSHFGNTFSKVGWLHVEISICLLPWLNYMGEFPIHCFGEWFGIENYIALPLSAGRIIMFGFRLSAWVGRMRLGYSANGGYVLSYFLCGVAWKVWHGGFDLACLNRYKLRSNGKMDDIVNCVMVWIGG